VPGSVSRVCLLRVLLVSEKHHGVHFTRRRGRALLIQPSPEVLKRQLYARAGVREYWMVDPGRRVITICSRTAPGVLDTTAELGAAAGDVLTSPLLPGFATALMTLFGPGSTEKR
jgi:hypothetical protein